MNLNLPVYLSLKYKNKSQIARVTTEQWVVDTIACPNCLGDFEQYTANKKSIDIFCKNCRIEFQIKSSKKKISKKIAGASYNATLESVQEGRNPSFMLLQYDELNMIIINFIIIHHSYISERCIEPRKPLSLTAKRAGWQGCMINISEVPEIAKLVIVNEGVFETNENIHQKWKSSNFIKKYTADKKSWLLDVLDILDKQKNEFTLADMYEYENFLKKIYPKNNNIKAKIRQLLQNLRDQNLLCFLGDGVYRKL